VLDVPLLLEARCRSISPFIQSGTGPQCDECEYVSMQVMIFGEAPPCAAFLRTLSELEAELNAVRPYARRQWCIATSNVQPFAIQ